MVENLKNILSGVLPDVDVELCEDFFDEGLDSMGVMTIISLIQSEMDIEIAPEDITADNFSKMEGLVELLKKYNK